MEGEGGGGGKLGVCSICVTLVIIYFHWSLGCCETVPPSAAVLLRLCLCSSVRVLHLCVQMLMFSAACTAHKPGSSCCVQGTRSLMGQDVVFTS